jgi:hypothetical protein
LILVKQHPTLLPIVALGLVWKSVKILRGHGQWRALKPRAGVKRHRI